MKTDILERIHSAALRFLLPLSLAEVYKVIVQEAIKLVNAQYGSLLVKDKENLVRVFTTLPPTIVSKRRIYKQAIIPKEGFTYKCFTEQKALVKRSREYNTTKDMWEAGLLSSIFIPMAYKRKSIGVLVVNSFENVDFTNKELEILKLYGSLASLAVSKTQLYEETKDALNARDTFIAMAGHELRTPLTTIIGYVQLLQGKIKQNIPEKKWIDELARESYRLSVLVNELLTVNKVSIGKLNYNFKVCNLREILDRVLKDFHFAHRHHPIKVKLTEADDKYNIVGDSDKLVQAIDNILDNAAKFSPKGSEVLINCILQKKDLVIEVKDQGNGIEKKDISRLFENYYRGSNKDSADGMGIGLYLTKSLITKHKGTIEIKSKPQQGTIVTVRLPLVEI